MSATGRGASRWTRRDFLRVGVGGLGLIGLAAACAPAPSAPAKPADAPKAAAPAAAPAASPPAAEALVKPGAMASPVAAPKQAGPAVAAAGKAIIMLGHEPPTLDSLIDSANTVRIHAFDNIHEGLVAYDNDMKMMPGLATSWERVDPKRMRFKLQQGVKFTDGEAFNADSVVASVKRLVDPDAKSSVLSFVDTLDRAEKVDDYTVDIITKVNDPILPRRLTFLPMFGANFIATKAASAADKPIGTGPYKLSEWVKGRYLRLVANEDYWGPNKPTIKEIDFVPRTEPNVRVTALKAGEAHLIDNVTPEDAATLPKEQVISKFATECMILRPNSLKGITADKRVRLAMSHSLDREAIVKEIMGGHALVPNGQPYIPSTFGYDNTMKDHEYDPEKAKALVKEAGAEGQELSIIGISVNRWLKDREIQQAFTAMISKSGLKVNLKLMEQAEWLAAGRDISANPPMDVWFTSAGNDLVDPDRILVAYGQTGGRLSLYSNPELDKMIEDERAELDEPKREAILKQIGRHMHENAVVIPIAQQNWIYGVSPKLEYAAIPNGQIIGNRLKLKA